MSYNHHRHHHHHHHYYYYQFDLGNTGTIHFQIKNNSSLKKKNTKQNKKNVAFAF